MKVNKKYIVSMVDFLTYYLHVENIDEYLTKINHYDITELNLEGVKRVPNEMVKDEDIESGRIILVESKGFKHHGNMVCAYVRPDLVVDQDKLSDLDRMINNALFKADTPLFRGKSLIRNRKQF